MDAAAPAQVLTLSQGVAAGYEPGAFYRRELPLLLAVVGQVTPTPRILIIDGYIWLDRRRTPGLGALLHEALDRRVAVIGVARRKVAGAASWCVRVERGASRRPLLVSALGIGAMQAAAAIRAMHGRHRIPTLLRLVDRAAREALP